MPKTYTVELSETTYQMFSEIGQYFNIPNADMAFRKICHAMITSINRDVAAEANKQFSQHAAEWMLHPSSFDEANAIFGPPAGKTEDEVYSLIAARIKWGDDDAVLSCWKPTQQQLDLIQETGRIWIALMCPQMIPICVMSQNPLDFEGIDVVDV